MKTLKIDEINANILKMLLRNARTSFTEIARENNVTPAAIRSRYQNLKNEGVITGAIMHLNPHRIGFNCYGFLGVKVYPKKVKEIKEYLIKQPYILATWNKIQEVNLGNFFAAPNLNYFTTITEKLKAHLYIKGVQPLIYSGLPFKIYPQNLVIEPGTELQSQPQTKRVEAIARAANEQWIKKCFIQTPELQQMNKVDREIALFLSQDARTPFSAIAKKVNMSTSHVIKKYNDLKKNKFFVGSSITIDPKKLGFQANAMVYITTEMGTKISDIHEQILKIPNVIVLVKVIGDCDILAIVPVNNFDDLFEIGEQFRLTEGIKNVKVKINPPFQNWPFDFFAPLIR